jgi:hypothetical protein
MHTVSDTAPETGTTDTAETAADSTETGAESSTDWRSEAEKFKGLQRKEEAARKVAERELGKLRREAMSDNERAVAEAVATAQAETAAEVTRRLGGRLVVAEIRGSVAGRLPDEAVTALTERLDLSTFLREDGDVDTEAVRKFAVEIAPEVNAPQTFPDLGQGARSSANGNALNDPLLRDLKGKLGIST